jgi:hypothetical protein
VALYLTPCGHQTDLPPSVRRYFSANFFMLRLLW